ncbi:MAG: hypothetical protein RIC56_11455 [Pseudomonadales bacterium]
MADAAPGSVQRQLVAYTGHYPLAFEVAMADADRGRAESIRDWFRERRYLSMAVILSLRLDGHGGPRRWILQDTLW